MGYLFTGESSGQLYSQTLDSSFAKTENGTTHINKFSTKVNIEVTDDSEQITIKEMDHNDKLIKITNYLRNSPDKFVMNINTKYIIVEELMRNVLEGTYIKRSIYDLDQKDLKNKLINHSCNFPEENGVMGIKSIQFISEQ